MTETQTLKAPFTYFGGKSRVARAVWKRLGDCANYCEPFFGSGAVLLARPHEPRIETVNDIDGYLANFWRAVQADPAAVAEWLNWPVNEVDLEARHKWLVEVNRKREHLQRMKDEPDYFDAKIAGWWCWGLCAWIGRGWCDGEWHGPGSENSTGCGINVRDPEHGGKRPHLSGGQGVHRQRPHLGDAGQGECECECERRGEVLRQWVQALADRLRNVRVSCGDWSRICGPSPTFILGTTGVFLDPPYSAEAGRDNAIYSHENATVAHDVRVWCLEHGDNPELRIALCGYEGEGHEELQSHGWRVLKWKAQGGYGGQNYQNKYRERVWFSPACLRQNVQREFVQCED